MGVKISLGLKSLDKLFLLPVIKFKISIIIYYIIIYYIIIYKYYIIRKFIQKFVL
jgi:hypothetical protein